MELRRGWRRGVPAPESRRSGVKCRVKYSRTPIHLQVGVLVTDSLLFSTTWRFFLEGPSKKEVGRICVDYQVVSTPVAPGGGLCTESVGAGCQPAPIDRIR
jgi:hypothetical protein